MTVEVVLAALKRAGTAKHRDGHARYGIVAAKAFGVPMGEIQKLAKGYGKSHDLAAKLWASGWYEARMSRVCRRARAGDAGADGSVVCRIR